MVDETEDGSFGGQARYRQHEARSQRLVTSSPTIKNVMSKNETLNAFHHVARGKHRGSYHGLV